MVPHRKPLEPFRYRYLRTVYRGKGLTSSRRLWYAVAALLLGLYLGDLVFGSHGMLRRRQLQEQLAGLVAGNARLRVDKSRLDQEVGLKENDPFSLEKLAREKYWMVGPDEVVFRFDDNETVPELPKDPGEAAPPSEPAGGSTGAGSGAGSGAASEAGGN